MQEAPRWYALYSSEGGHSGFSIRPVAGGKRMWENTWEWEEATEPLFNERFRFLELMAIVSEHDMIALAAAMMRAVGGEIVDEYVEWPPETEEVEE